MRTAEENQELANLLFPNHNTSVEDLFERYPKRNIEKGEMILRFAPSPTGFLHIGSVYTGMICTKLSKQSGGLAILRIEDTDKKREVEDGVTMIVNGLKGFGISFDEGPSDDKNQKGEYGPYIQSQRLDIYKTFAKEIVKKGNAYPCFISEEELISIRKEQKSLGVRTGYYGKWAKWRDASLEEIKKELDKGTPYVIRLYSTGSIDNTFEMIDLIKGKVTLRENDMDAVLLKSDGFPTYHFAHPIDDTLMGITLVTRGDEWFPSVPLHFEIFQKLGLEQIPYAHFSPLMKVDHEGKSKRKLSKRKDPEADVSFYINHGYPKEAVIEYLLNLANSNFSDWRIQNPDKSHNEFVLKIEKFNKAGSLFDIVKLSDMCKDYISTLSAQQVYENCLEWAKLHDSKIEKLLLENKEYCISIFNIERSGAKIRKDIVKFEDCKEQLALFFDELFIGEYEDILEMVSKEIQKEILSEYKKIYSTKDNEVEWFEKVKELSKKLGFSTDRKEYEANKEKFKGTVGDVAMVLRVAITGRTKSPNLYQVMLVLGEEKVMQRLDKYISYISKMV
ncbi:MAG TPA: glutamate--tRNA ligase [Candidatus Dojkabacteria bacterium]|nr:glutamate--tRNA ligase [Candidatus Dojkabacteria bacterium]